MRFLNQAQVALIVVCAGYLIAPMGLAAVNVAIPALANDLKADAAMVGWLPTIYLLSNVALLLPAGKLADNFGRKRVYIWGLVLNALAAIMCAVATNIEQVLFWRFMQGAAGAMIFGTGVAIVASVVPDNKRGSALGIVATFVYVGLTAAPAVGGYLTDLIDWRAVFYFQVPLLVVLVVYISIALKGEWKSEKRVNFDYKGTALFATFAFCLVIGLSELPNTLGIVITLGSILALIVFIIHQSKSSKPLIRIQMLKESRVLSASLATSFFMYGSNFAVIFLISLYLQYIQGHSPAFAGKVLMIQALAMAVMAPVAGKLSDRFEARVVATLGCFIVAIGFMIMNQIDLDTTTLRVSIALLLIGIGFGLFSTPNNSAIVGAVPKSEVGVASASMNLSRTVGNLFGMSLVNLMIQYYLGDSTIDETQIEALMLTVSLALKMSLIFVIVAVFVSSMRGRLVV